ncbi:metalloregulator ArsR/SmtB family transcription factor [Sphingosinicella sp.]|uniref:ArsR/SmtB family transcription factor n=1 Tax=Sphingosinicella sp. TaxID=1917971 RepID=UPI0018595732|nr:metalloregulator ArsR/SmtB family transcription factor [Sphingosinicella sp.]MBA4758716.1 helix-turn-helix transcriptional regulator [Sphingosinicella sp.]
MMMADTPAAMLAACAEDAAAVLKLLAHPQRLIVLCRLSAGEASVNTLVDLTGQSQSSVSQHLAKLREGGMVATRREGTTIFYRLADDGVHALIDMLCDRFGGPAKMAKA